ncbi:MAG: CTP synthase [Patescibacteria group bacterium]
MNTRFIFVLGGVMSGVGKGTSVASIGAILKSKGFKVEAVKIDPYVNVDAGTMNPVEHGEVFVTKDGDETDQDIGNYERFLNQDITRENYMTTGRVYLSVIQRERNLEYKGRCVEVVPCVPEEVIRRLDYVAKKSKADFVIIEIGGTVGEYENILFLEALRMMKLRAPRNVQSILVSYLPVPPSIGEMKTKPTQHAVREMNRVGIAPDFLICRSQQPLDEPRREKLSRFCGVHPTHIITAENAKSVYEVPGNFERQNLGNALLKAFGVRPRPSRLEPWNMLAHRLQTVKKEVKIGVVGKYFSTGDFVLSDVYLSVLEAIKHAAWDQNRKPVIEWLNAEEYEKNPGSVRELKKYDGVLIPGGFGSRGVEGKIRAIQFIRENRIPYFGLCYGMQCAVIEFARNVLGLKSANTTEINPKTPHPVIHLMNGQDKNVQEKKMGGTLRLGSYPFVLKNGSVADRSYKTNKTYVLSERHRHRYEFNNAYRAELEAEGLIVSGESPDGMLAEIVEIPMHQFFVGVQFHPEFQSRPLFPHPLFRAFIKAAIKNSSLRA